MKLNLSEALKMRVKLSSFKVNYLGYIRSTTNKIQTHIRTPKYCKLPLYFNNAKKNNIVLIIKSEPNVIDQKKKSESNISGKKKSQFSAKFLNTQ